MKKLNWLWGGLVAVIIVAGIIWAATNYEHSDSQKNRGVPAIARANAINFLLF